MDSEISRLIENLKNEWLASPVEADTLERKMGYISGLRHMHVDIDGYNRFKNTLDELYQHVNEGNYKIVVEQIYKIPFYMMSWKKKCVENGFSESEYDSQIREVSNKVDKIVTKCII